MNELAHFENQHRKKPNRINGVEDIGRERERESVVEKREWERKKELANLNSINNLLHTNTVYYYVNATRLIKGYREYTV